MLSNEKTNCCLADLSKGGRPSGCSDDVVACIEAYVNDHPSYTQQEVTNHINRTLGVRVSRPTVCRWMQRLRHYSCGAGGVSSQSYSASEHEDRSYEAAEPSSTTFPVAFLGSSDSVFTDEDDGWTPVCDNGKPGEWEKDMLAEFELSPLPSLEEFRFDVDSNEQLLLGILGNEDVEGV